MSRNKRTGTKGTQDPPPPVPAPKFIWSEFNLLDEEYERELDDYYELPDIYDGSD